MTENNLQPNYNRYAPTAQKGTPASMTGWDVDTRLCESPVIKFAVAVSQGENDRGAILGVPSGSKFVGVTVSDITLDQTDRDDPESYKETENMGVAIEGDIWVVADDNVTPVSDVTFNAASGEEWGSGDTKLDGAKFMTSAAEGDLVVLRLNGDMSTSDVA